MRPPPLTVPRDVALRNGLFELCNGRGARAANALVGGGAIEIEVDEPRLRGEAQARGAIRGSETLANGVRAREVVMKPQVDDVRSDFHEANIELRGE